MADIELLIKIPEELYKDIKEHGLCGYCSDREIMSEAICNGTPLPKGHGRLIDADALIFNADYYEPLISKRDFDFAPTIIEADKIESGIEKRKSCINCEDGCEEWAGCPCVHYKAESEDKE